MLLHWTYLKKELIKADSWLECSSASPPVWASRICAWPGPGAGLVAAAGEWRAWRAWRVRPRVWRSSDTGDSAHPPPSPWLLLCHTQGGHPYYRLKWNNFFMSKFNIVDKNTWGGETSAVSPNVTIRLLLVKLRVFSCRLFYNSILWAR